MTAGNMSPAKWRDLALSFATAGLGAFVFAVIGFPSAPLTGAAVLISIASLYGLRTEMPGWMRDGAFILLGINIGTGVTPEVLRSAVQWPLSIAVLLVCLIVSMLLTRTVLVRFMGFDRQSATLASAPGHLSYVISLASDGKTDLARIAIVQSIRLLIITLFISVFVASWFGDSGIDLLPTTVMTPVALGISVIITFLAGVLFTRIRIPAAFLLAGMAVSSGLHAFDLTPGRMPDLLNFIAFLIMGMLIGSRFSGQTWQAVREALSAGLCVTAINIVVALIGAALITVSLGAPISQLIVAFAPGGVEAMAAIALMLGIDPAFVAAHHVARLMMLTFLIPMLIKR